MSTTLQPVFEALGIRDEAEQIARVKWLQANGAYGQLPDVNGMVSDQQALAILKGVSFSNAVEAADFLHEKTQKAVRAPRSTDDPSILKEPPLRKDMPIVLLDPKTIKTDPTTYQYRTQGDGNGVTEAHRIAATEWDAVLHGNPLLVHVCAENGEEVKYLVDGHHRLQLAKDLIAQGKGPEKIAALELRGVTKQEAKLIGAVKNIIEHAKQLDKNPVELVDAARAVQEINDSGIDWKKMPRLPLENNYNISLAIQISGFSEKTKKAIATGEVAVPVVKEVIERVPGDTCKQEAVLGHIRSRTRDSVSPRVNPESPSTEMLFVTRLQQQREQTSRMPGHMAI